MPRTAKQGKADWSLNGVTFVNIPEVRKVDFTPSTEAKEYASSSTNGAMRRLEGLDDFDGSIDVYIDPDVRFDAESFGIRPGVTAFIRAYEHRDDVPFILPVYIDDVSYSVDVEGGEIIGATISFSADGPIEYPE